MIDIIDNTNNIGPSTVDRHSHRSQFTTRTVSI